MVLVRDPPADASVRNPPNADDSGKGKDSVGEKAGDRR